MIGNIEHLMYYFYIYMPTDKHNNYKHNILGIREKTKKCIKIITECSPIIIYLQKEPSTYMTINVACSQYLIFFIDECSKFNDTIS